MLDDDYGISLFLQASQRLDELLRIALVKPDARLIENVHHAAKTGADLACDTDTLRLAAADGARIAPKREVSKSHIL